MENVYLTAGDSIRIQSSSSCCSVSRETPPARQLAWSPSALIDLVDQPPSRRRANCRACSGCCTEQSQAGVSHARLQAHRRPVCCSIEFPARSCGRSDRGPDRWRPYPGRAPPPVANGCPILRSAAAGTCTHARLVWPLQVSRYLSAGRAFFFFLLCRMTSETAIASEARSTAATGFCSTARRIASNISLALHPLSWPTLFFFRFFHFLPFRFSFSPSAAGVSVVSVGCVGRRIN